MMNTATTAAALTTPAAPAPFKVRKGDFVLFLFGDLPWVAEVRSAGPRRAVLAGESIGGGYHSKGSNTFNSFSPEFYRVGTREQAESYRAQRQTLWEDMGRPRLSDPQRVTYEATCRRMALRIFSA